MGFQEEWLASDKHPKSNLGLDHLIAELHMSLYMAMVERGERRVRLRFSFLSSIFIVYLLGQAGFLGQSLPALKITLGSAGWPNCCLNPNNPNSCPDILDGLGAERFCMDSGSISSICVNLPGLRLHCYSSPFFFIKWSRLVCFYIFESAYLINSNNLTKGQMAKLHMAWNYTIGLPYRGSALFITIYMT